MKFTCRLCTQILSPLRQSNLQSGSLLSKKKECFGLCCKRTAFLLTLKRSDCSHYTFSKCLGSVSFLVCQGGRNHASSHPSPLLHFPFPKWPPTPGMTSFYLLFLHQINLSTCCDFYQPVKSKNVTSAINWNCWPLLSGRKGFGAVGWLCLCTTHTLKSAGDDECQKVTFTSVERLSSLYLMS